VAAAALVASVLAFAASRPARVEETIDSAHVAAEMAEAARNLWGALSPEQQARIRFELADAERVNWHFIPKDRQGLPLREMTAAQQKLAHALLATGVSHRGYLTAVTIMSLEQILADLEKNPVRRDPDKYYVTIFGTPGAGATWGWRVEGHHLSLNFAVAGGRAVAAHPTFFGANPAEVREGGRTGTRPLAGEAEIARKLIASLSPEQRREAVFSDKSPDDILTTPGRSLTQVGLAGGLPSSKLSAEQRALLLELVAHYAGHHRGPIAEADVAAARAAAPEAVLFAWAGGLEPGQGHYYRVKGPGFLIEFVNTQNNANHIHSVWHDLKNDFGEDLLREHFKQHPK
jgi:hypothetical protein